MRNLERVKVYTSSLLPVWAAIALWTTCAGIVRVQGNAAAAEEAAVPIELLSSAVRDSGASLVPAATIDDVGGTVRFAPGKSPRAGGLSEEDSGAGSCDAELHDGSGSEEFGDLLKGVSVATITSEREKHTI